MRSCTKMTVCLTISLLLAAHAQADFFSEVGSNGQSLANSLTKKGAQPPGVAALKSNLVQLKDSTLSGLRGINIKSQMTPVFNQYGVDDSSVSSAAAAVEKLPQAQQTGFLAAVLDVPVKILNMIISSGTKSMSSSAGRKLLRV